jgi:hypothetical protein
VGAVVNSTVDAAVASQCVQAVEQKTESGAGSLLSEANALFRMLYLLGWLPGPLLPAWLI